MNKSGLVYMLQSGPYIKLGYTGQVSLNSRLHQIRNACPYDIAVLATRPATYEQEQELHAGAIQWRHPTRERSDWYLDCPELREYCDGFFFADRDATDETEALLTKDTPAVVHSVSISEESDVLFGRQSPI